MEGPSYEERPSAVAGAVLWSREMGPGGGHTRVLPDGCMDLLLWDGELVIAGPDTHAHLVRESPGRRRVTGLRFAPGTGPRFFGVPAHELRDLRVPLTAVWPDARVRELAERATEDGLERAALRLATAYGPDPLPAAVLAELRAGRTVTEIAASTGVTERTLHRRCTAAFGYGPKTLDRVLRLQRALELARAGTPLATAAARAGYADQAHLSREVRALAGVTASDLLRA
ncbi:helix-turn-helix domain-containing protein [Streptomyces sp. ODS28]|uniref:helix-turn-helix domain-containing protein n=1 Tax=Streptomyces sp. ODS28 TaxID=3136688 RepID=UPI0031E5E064